jgi:hypothetical protein
MRIAWIGLVAACSKTDPLYCMDHREDIATCGEISVDGSTTDTPTPPCLGTAAPNWTVCFAPPTGPVELPGMINTDTDSKCQSNLWMSATQTDSCFIVATAITMGATDTIVTGSRPLVLVSTSTISITKTLDVASHVAGKTGPNANGKSCGGGTNGTQNGSQWGGGGGGSFATMGGNGGNGNGNTGAAGKATDIVPPKGLAGGCAGKPGGNANGQGVPGAGGGGVALLAQGEITVNGAIDASGAAGGQNTATNHQNGGNGAGSGGMIAMIAPTISGTGIIFANGGGGGCGGDGGTLDGGAGTDPGNPFIVAFGCLGGGDSHGGAGFASMSNGTPINAGNGDNGGSNQTGGGGGGGGGFVSSDLPIATSLFVSPTRTDLP